MENTNEGEVLAEQEVVTETEAEIVEHEEATEEEKDTTDWKAKHDELAARLQRAEKKLEKAKAEKPVQKSGELGDAVLDFFTLKGYDSEEEVEVFENIMKRTGMSHREVIKDEYALSKIESLRKAKEVKDATPSATRRSGGQTNNVDYWVSKFDQDGSLPSDFKLRAEVVDKVTSRGSNNVPPWRK